MIPEEIKRHERRVNWPQEIDASFWGELRHHMETEHLKFEAGEERMDRIEEDLRPIKKMYWAVLGSATVGVMLLATLIYIYQSDKGEYREARLETKELATAIYKQGTVLERLLTTHQALEQDYRRTVDRLDREREQQGIRRADR